MIAGTVDRPVRGRYTPLRRELPERGLSLSLTAVINELCNSRGIIHSFLALANFSDRKHDRSDIVFTASAVN